MARQAAQENMLYYPTAAPVATQLGRMVHITSTMVQLTVLDPCLGEGIALQAFLDGVAEGVAPSWLRADLRSYYPGVVREAVKTAKVFGVEIHEQRAAKARKEHKDWRVVTSPWEHVDVSGQANLIWMNPPYDTVKGERVEKVWIKSALAALAERGSAVMILPEMFHTDKKLFEWIKSAFSRELCDGAMLRFPDEHWEPWHQIAFVATKRRSEKYAYSYFDETAYAIDNSDRRRIIVGESVSAANRLLLRKVKVKEIPSIFADGHNPAILQDYLGKPATTFEMTPLMPLTNEYAAGVAAAGMFNGQAIDGRVWKGTTVKKKVYLVTENEGGGKKEEWFDTLAVQIATTDLTTGEMTVFNNHDHKKTFDDEFITHAPAFVELAKRLYPALEPLLPPTLLSSVHAPRALTGHLNGMFEAQQIRALALLAGWQKMKMLTLLGEPGVGKTVIAFATSVLRLAGKKTDRQQVRGKVVVLLPAKVDLVEKWAEEIKLSLRDFDLHVAEVETPRQVAAEMERDGLGFVLMRETMAKQSSGWTPILGGRSGRYHYLYGRARRKLAKRRRKLLAFSASGRNFLPKKPDRTRTVLIEHKPQRKYINIPRRWWSYRCPACGAAISWYKTPDAETESDPNKHQIRCTFQLKAATETEAAVYCNEPLFQYARRTKGDVPTLSGSFRKFDEAVIAFRKRWPRIAHNDGPSLAGYKPSLRRPTPSWARIERCQHRRWRQFKLPDNPGFARWPLARFLRQRYKGYVLIIDEAHQYRGAATARAYAYADLISASSRALQMTGTLYNGYASSLFYMLWRTSSSFRSMYNIDAVQDFINDYGLFKLTRITRNGRGGSSRSGYEEVIERKSELPGFSPQMLKLLLPSMVSMKLADLGEEIPRQIENTLYVDMPHDTHGVVREYLEDLKDAANSAAKDGDMSLMGQFRWAKLGAWDMLRQGDEVVADWGSRWAFPPQTAPADLWSKEEALVRIAIEAAQADTNVLVAINQNHRRPIVADLIEVLGRYGIKAAFLPETEKHRVKWINEQLDSGVRVIFSNPELVKEGIDLLRFHRVVWWSVEYVTDLIFQFNARTHRIGTSRETIVYYLAYNETPQSEGWHLMAEKMGAAQGAHGDIRRGLSDLVGNYSFLDAMQKAAISIARYGSRLTIEDLPALTIIEAAPPQAPIIAQLPVIVPVFTLPVDPKLFAQLSLW